MGSIISILNEKGGCGKTTTTLELAYLLGKNSRNGVLVVDVDGQANASLILQKNEAKKSMADVFIHDEHIGNVIQESRKEWSKVFLCSSDKRMSSIESHLVAKFQRETILKKALSHIVNEFDFVLLDLPPAMNILHVNALACSQGFLVPTDSSEFGLEGINSVLELAHLIKSSGLNNALTFLGAFVTSAQKANSNDYRAFSKDLKTTLPGNPLEDIIIPHSTKVGEARRLRKPISVAFPSCSPVFQYRQLSYVIEEKFQQQKEKNNMEASV